MEGITPEQAKAICERHAANRRVNLRWIGEYRCKLYGLRRGRNRELGELRCVRPFLPVSSTGYSIEVGDLREAILSEVWERFPAERA